MSKTILTALLILFQYFSYSQNICIDKILKDATFLEKNSQQISTGTGFLISSDGVILTNRHVVGGINKKIFVSFQFNGKVVRREAQILFNSLEYDLAKLKCDVSGLGITSILPYGIDFRQPKLGEQISVLGYPMPGIMGQSIKLTTGVVSSTNGFMDNKNLFQISAPIQPGNSGSPIFDMYGNVIGIAVSSLTSGQNVNYALKSNLMNESSKKVESSKRAVMPSLTSLQKFICLISVESDKTYYPELKFKEGNFNILQPSFFETIVTKDAPCESLSISKLTLMENEEITNFQMKKLLNNKYANAVYQTYKLNRVWNGMDSYQKLYALLDIGAYDNIIDEVDELNPTNINKESRWFYYGTAFIPYAYSKLYKLSSEPDRNSIQNIITSIDEAIEIVLDDLNHPPAPNEERDKINLGDYYRLLANFYIILNEKSKVSKNYQLALQFAPTSRSEFIETFLRKN